MVEATAVVSLSMNLIFHRIRDTAQLPHEANNFSANKSTRCQPVMSGYGIRSSHFSNFVFSWSILKTIFDFSTVELWNILFNLSFNRKSRKIRNQTSPMSECAVTVVIAIFHTRLQQTFKDDDGAIFFHYRRFVFCSLHSMGSQWMQTTLFSFSVHFSPRSCSLLLPLDRLPSHVTVAYCDWQPFVSISMIHLRRWQTWPPAPGCC